MTDAPEPTGDVADDQLAALPAERLAQMLRDKRKAEATVRTKLRDTETARDALAETVSGFQREAFNGQATEAGVIPTALADLPLHVQLTDLLGENGLLDGDKTAAALSDLKTEKPHLFTRIAGASGAQSFENYRAPDSGPSWGDVIR